MAWGPTSLCFSIELLRSLHAYSGFQEEKNGFEVSQMGPGSDQAETPQPWSLGYIPKQDGTLSGGRISLLESCEGAFCRRIGKV